MLAEIVNCRVDLPNIHGAIRGTIPTLCHQRNIQYIHGCIEYLTTTFYPILIVEEDVVHDGHHPTFEVDVAYKLVSVGQSAKRSILYEIVCIVGILR